MGPSKPTGAPDDPARGFRSAAVAAGSIAGLAPAKVTDDAEFRRDLGADSLDLVEIPAAIEEAFGIILSDDEVAFCETVGTATDLVETKLENRRVL